MCHLRRLTTEVETRSSSRLVKFLSREVRPKQDRFTMRSSRKPVERSVASGGPYQVVDDIPPDLPLVSAEVFPGGDHELEIWHGDYVEQRVTVCIVPGEVTTVRVQLIPEPEKPRDG